MTAVSETTQPPTSADFNSIRWTHQYPDVAAHQVRASAYTDPAYFELERERMFKKVWLYVGREERVANPGDYLVRDIEVAGASIIVVRGRDGRLRAFHNVCTHRGNKLLADRGGSCKQITCIFHGWAFKLDGSLSGVPGERQFHEFDKADHGLTPVSVDVWDGFVFVHLDREPAQTLADYIGPMAADMAGFPFHTMTKQYRYTSTFRANWKLGVDAFQEFYHVGFIHQQSIGETVHNAANPNSSALLIKIYDRHRMFSGYGNTGYQPSAVDMVSFKAGMSITNLLSSEDGKKAIHPPGLNPTGSDTWSFDLNVVFPNFIIFRYAGGMYLTHQFWPVAVDKVTYEVTVNFVEPSTPGELFSRQQTAITARDSLLEDLFTLEQTQKGLESGVLDVLPLQDNEMTIRHGAKMVDDYVTGRRS